MDFFSYFLDALGRRILHHRHHQSVEIQVHRDADVHAPVQNEMITVVARVQPRELGERECHGARDERQAALEEMHDLLSAAARREGIVLRDRDYQLAQWRALGEAGIASLWFGRVGEQRWTGSVLLRCGAILHQYQAGSADDADLRAVPANHLLQWEILRWAVAAGFTGYDLGGVDAPAARGLPRDERHPLWNLYVFKRGFGAQGVEYVRAHEDAPNPLVRVAWRVARLLR